MAPDADQLARQLARRSDAELLALTPSVPDAFDVFFVRHSKAIASYLWRLTGNHEVAADLTSETFAVALESVGRYDPAKGDARGWLFGIARITMLSSFRQQRSERAARLRLGHSVLGHSDEAWEEAESRIDAALPGLVEDIEHLPRAERRAVVARVLEEREYAEIAASEAATEAAIRQRVKRGLGRLRKRIEGDGR
ncbi:MAG TPA: sigma-70 family RNA polymerase sigma factor [Thermoleophilaceae bacterium]|nr:sigma-70 family RNA polymerase sigma factor [Thermoleophilaceae bacterium]